MIELLTFKVIAFTLAEVLIALALIGVVAAFTIPNILKIADHNDEKAKFREILATLSELTYSAQLSSTLDGATL